MIRKIVNKTLHYSFLASKRLLNRTPRIKKAIKRILYTQLGISLASDTNYKKWVEIKFPDFMDIAAMRKEIERFKYKPLISIVVPTYNTDPMFLRECFDSVIGQVYEAWELCIVDDASTHEEVRKIINEYKLKDKRINAIFLKKNLHISGATNRALKMTKGEFVSLLDHDDVLWPNALFEVVKALNIDSTLDFIYTDEDKITEDRREHLGPFFKPDWNPDFLHSVNFITHLATIRKKTLEEINGFNRDYDGAQDWDLFMRLTSATDKIHHIPKVVYSWRVHEESTAKHTEAKPYVVEAQRQAIKEDLSRKGYSDAAVEQDQKHKGYWHTNIPLHGEPLMSIIIPTKDQYKIVRRCLDSIFSKTTYKKYEVIVVDTGSSDKRVLRWYKKLQKKYTNLTIVDWPERPFSYSRACNRGAEIAKGDLLLFLNNDTEVLTNNWLELLGGDAQRNEIGAVGCLLLYSDGYHIQHAGV
jgi:glycosyltransferase involved in cell wall biosynthesis